MPIPNPEPTPVAPATPPAEPATPISIDPANLPPELQGKSAVEIQMMVAQMPGIIRNQRDSISLMEDRLRTPVAAPLPPEPPAAPVDFDALMEENPTAALDHYMTSRYGATIDSIDARLGAGEFQRVASTIPGFTEHSDDVQKMLTDSNTPVNEANVRGAYAMVIGQKEIMRQDTLRRAAVNEPPVTPAPVDPVLTDAPLSALETEVAAAMGLSHEDFRKYGDAESFNPSVRTT